MVLQDPRTPDLLWLNCNCSESKEKRKRQRKRELLFHPVSSESENLVILKLPKETVDQEKDEYQVKLNAEKMFKHAELKVLDS